MVFPALLSMDSLIQMGLSKLNPQVKEKVLALAKKHLETNNPIQSALREHGITPEMLKREGLPMLRSGKLAQEISKMPGANILLNRVEEYISKIQTAESGSAGKHPQDTGDTQEGFAKRTGNPFPPLKPKS